MNWQPKTLSALVLLFGAFLVAGGVELTFELPDNAKQCFYQEIEKNVSSTLEFQVNCYLLNLAAVIRLFGYFKNIAAFVVVSAL